MEFANYLTQTFVCDQSTADQIFVIWFSLCVNIAVFTVLRYADDVDQRDK